MDYREYVIEVGDPDQPDQEPFELEVYLVPKGENLYQVFDAGAPWMFYPFRQGDTITANLLANGNLTFVEVVSKSANRRMTYQCNVKKFTDEMLRDILGDYPGSKEHWDPTPQLQALLDRIMAAGGNYDFEFGTLSLYLPPGVELTEAEIKRLEDGHDLLVTVARLQFNTRSGSPDPKTTWTVRLPDNK